MKGSEGKKKGKEEKFENGLIDRGREKKKQFQLASLFGIAYVVCIEHSFSYW